MIRQGKQKIVRFERRAKSKITASRPEAASGDEEPPPPKAQPARILRKREPKVFETEQKPDINYTRDYAINRQDYSLMQPYFSESDITDWFDDDFEDMNKIDIAQEYQNNIAKLAKYLMLLIKKNCIYIESERKDKVY